jgi:exosortase
LRLANPLSLAGLAALTVAVLVYSPWLSAVAFVLSVGGVMLGLRAGWAWRDWLPVWVLMWLMVPPPLDWDEDMIRGLQSIASRGCSPVLDVLGVRHLVEGNVLVLPGHRLLVAEACSGVNSLFTLLIATALFVVLAKRPLVRSVLLLASSVFWAGLMNMVRVVTVALAQSWLGVNISSGWQHETLGFVTVGLALLMVASTDRLLAFLLGPIEFPDEQSRRNPLSRGWNWCVGSGDSHVAPTLNESAAAQTAPCVGEIPAGSNRANWGIVAGFVVLGVVQLSGSALALFSARAETSGANLLAHENLFQREDLPRTVGGWTQVEYSVGDYDPTREIGAYRQIWAYQLGKQCRCTISADYPFGGWHNLSVCYVASGWRVVDRTEQPSTSESTPAPDPYVEVGMVRPDGEHGLLLFSLVSPAGCGLDVPEESTWKRITSRFASIPLSRWMPKGTAFAGRETTLQVQALVSSPDPLTAPGREAVRQLFVTLRQRLMSAYTHKQASGRQ